MSQSFQPLKRVLMGPGPSDVSERVLNALSKPTIGHLDPLFVEFMEDLKNLLKQAFLTTNKMTFPLSAPASAAMEMALVNLLEEGDEILICINGVFGKRMLDIAQRIKAKVHVLECEWGQAVDPTQVEDFLTKNSDIQIVAFVHAETSTGALSDAKSISEIAQKFNCLTIVDTVTSLGGVELKVDEWGLDVVYSGTQKNLSAPPGLSPITFSEKAIERIKKRKSKCPSWFLDLELLLTYWNGDGGRSYHHTAPINNLYGLHEALLILLEEGLKNSWDRHRTTHEMLASECEKRSLEFYVAKEQRLPNLNAIVIPNQFDDQRFRSFLLNEKSIEIGAGLGPLQGKIWRVGLMGQSCSREHVQKFMSAFDDYSNS